MEYNEDFVLQFINYKQKHPFGLIFEDFCNKSMVSTDGYSQERLIYNLLYNVTILPTDPVKFTRNAKFIPGGCFDGRVGPKENISVVIVTPIPDDRSAPLNRDASHFNVVPIVDQLLGDTKDLLIGVFQDCGIPEHVWRDFYVTTLCRFPRIDAGLKKTIPAAWIKEGLPILEHELRLIKPTVIIGMGTDVSKKLVNYPVTKAISNVFDYDIDGHIAKVVCVNDPKKILALPEERPLFASGFASAYRILSDGSSTVQHDRSQYQFIENIEDLSAAVDKLISQDVYEFAIDCEWGGGHYLDPAAGLRTVQLAWSDKEAMVVVLRRQHMKSAFSPYISSAFVALRKLIYRTGVRIIGHGISADYPWLRDAGLDIGGYLYFDTMLASHLFEPTMSHSLEDLASKHIPGWVRQDFALTEWKTKNPIAKGDGYRDVPDDLLHPYGGDDAVSTYLLYRYYQRQFEIPDNAGLRNLFCTLVMPALIPLIGIELAGVQMDLDRIIPMCEDYKQVYNRLLEDFQGYIGDPNFNPKSPLQKQELLFNKLKLKPVKTTGDIPILWEDVEERNLEDKVSPSVDGETLETLAVESNVAKDLHCITLLDTVLKNQLVPPKINSHGDLEYVSGFAGFIKPDGRIHTRISQMLKTGRLASLDPNIMNIANRQEIAVQELFKSMNISIPKLRSVFTAPRGKLLVTADYTQAEIAALAYASGDKNLIQAVVNREDIHSVVCKQMFQLDCPLDAIKNDYKNLRVAAKSIVFGLLYGRGRKAIAREVRKVGVELTDEEAGEFMDTFMQRFPLVSAMIERTHSLVETRGWVETLWGRRAFYPSVAGLGNSEQLLAGQKRKSFNFLIQGYVGDLLRCALINFHKFKAENSDINFDIILTVHDSIMAEVAVKDVEVVTNHVFPMCMSQLAVCPRLPFCIAIDIDVTERWDETLYFEDFISLGISEQFAGEYCRKDKDGNIEKEIVI